MEYIIGYMKKSLDSAGDFLRYKFISIRHSFRQTVKSIKNLYRYAPLIWRDRDWDYAFFLMLLKFKLERMLDYYEKGTILVDRDKFVICTSIQECIGCLDRISEDAYEEASWAEHTKRFGELKMHFGKPDPKSQSRSVTFTPNSKKAVNFRRKIYLTSDQLREADYHRLFSLLRKNVRKWWD